MTDTAISRIVDYALATDFAVRARSRSHRLVAPSRVRVAAARLGTPPMG